MIRAITLTQPWASAVLKLGKTVENGNHRPLCIGVGGRLAIHAGLQVDQEAYRDILHGRYGSVMPAGGIDIPTGVILGSVELGGWIGQDADGSVRGEAAPGEWSQLLKLLDSPWRNPEARWHWWVRKPRVLEKPIPCKGSQGLWKVPSQYVAAMEAL